MNIKAERSLWGGSILLVALALCVAILALRMEKAENERVRGAFAVMVERSKWSCDLDEGERVICAVKDSSLSRLVLADGDHVVEHVVASKVGSPLGKAKKRRSKP